MCTRILASFVSGEVQYLFAEAAHIRSNLEAQVQSFSRDNGSRFDSSTHQGCFIIPAPPAVIMKTT